LKFVAGQRGSSVRREQVHVRFSQNGGTFCDTRRVAAPGFPEVCLRRRSQNAGVLSRFYWDPFGDAARKLRQPFDLRAVSQKSRFTKVEKPRVPALYVISRLTAPHKTAAAERSNGVCHPSFPHRFQPGALDALQPAGFATTTANRRPTSWGIQNGFNRSH
jgi:hypothetical protein